MEFKTGNLVHTRGRDWVVLASESKDLLRLKPLDGRENDEVGIYMPLVKNGELKSSQFYPPTFADLGNIRSAQLLFDASRISLRSASGPFRCAAKLGFRPRSYQMVPLIMALKQDDPMRLLIADDVGVGKTIEAILIVKELLERREIKSFAVLCPPHLCEQWQMELKDKFQLDAVIIRTGTIASLERQVPGDKSIFEHFPYQVISIDFIKSDSRYKIYAERCPELVIVDEAHSCAKPEGHISSNQQLRHRLVKEIANKKNQHLILVTATPHSGKEAEFRSLLGLLKEGFESLDWDKEVDYEEGISKKDFRRDLAKYFVQRKRENIAAWMGERTPFPERTALELSYVLSDSYQSLYDELLLYTTKMMTRDKGSENEKRFRYWSALALLRGVMSSPPAGSFMLQNRISNLSAEEVDLGDSDENPHIERLEKIDDELPVNLVAQAKPTETDIKAYETFSQRLSLLHGIEKDIKIASTLKQVRSWAKEGFNPIIFCRYIETAKYVAEELEKNLSKNVLIECVTSEDPDEIRRQRIEAMAGEEGHKHMRVLVATDCLSEGINLQDLFDAVLHYDLPWNPNRLEQREGRVDRFGQKKKEVQTCLLYGKDNPMDRVVLRVLLRKVKTIRDSIGVSIPFPENSKGFLDTMFKAILEEAEKKQVSSKQLNLFSLEDIVRSEDALGALFAVAEKKEKALRSIFAQRAIKAEDIEEDLAITDEAVGRPETVYRFVKDVFESAFGIAVKSNDEHLELQIRRSAWPKTLENLLTKKSQKESIDLAFLSPVREGFQYWGRNHEGVETLCRKILSMALFTEERLSTASRAAVAVSAAVKEKTVVYVLRARHVIEDRRIKSHMVAEEVLLYGVEGVNRKSISSEKIHELMENPQTVADLPDETQRIHFERERSLLTGMNEYFNELAYTRAQDLIAQHKRYDAALGSMSKAERYEVVKPVIPLDVLGLYVFIPGGQA